MEVLSMLRYWRGGATGSGSGGSCSTGKDANANLGSSSSSGHATITTSAFLPSAYDEGPFFDLHLAVPDDAAAEGEIDSNFEEEEEEDARKSIKSVEFSAADGEEMVFKGRLVPIDSSVIIDENTHLAGPLVKSNTKLSVFFLGLKKPATSIGSVLKGSDDAAAAEGTSSSTKEKPQNHRLFTVKFKGEEVRLVSFFTRENSRNGSKQNKDSSEDGSSPATETGTGGISGEVKGKAKVTVQKYLNAIKPLYEKVAKKNGDNYKVGFSGNLNAGGQGKGRCTTVAARGQDSVPSGPARQGSFPLGLKVVYKHFGKSRSASWPASTGSSSSAAAASVAGSGSQAQRRDDSLLQQQDGIQSAIAHCKQSYSSITDSGSTEGGLRSHHGFSLY